MYNISIFFNTKIEHRYNQNNPKPEKLNYGKITAAIGDWFLEPVRCLCNGKIVTITLGTPRTYTEFNQSTQSDVTVSDNRRFNSSNTNRDLYRIARAITLLIPSIFFGTLIKGASYLSGEVRKSHAAVKKHLTPLQEFILKANDIQDLKEQIESFADKNRYNQSVDNLIIETSSPLQLVEDVGICNLNPRKIILINANIATTGSLSDDLKNNPLWEEAANIKDKTRLLKDTGLAQWKVKSVQEALQDLPPRLSFFTTERYRRVYIRVITPKKS